MKQMRQVFSMREAAQKAGIPFSTFAEKVRAGVYCPSGSLHAKRGKYFTEKSLSGEKDRLLLVTKNDLAKALGVHVRTIENRLKRGVLIPDGHIDRFPVWDQKSVKKLIAETKQDK